MTETPRESADDFAEVARNLLDRGSVQATLEEIAALAVREIEGCEFAGISLLHKGGSITTPAATVPLADMADQIQYTTGQGPCLESIKDREVYIIDDTAQETRWPVFSAQVCELGVQSMMSHQLYTRRQVLGSLNMYSSELKAFDAESSSIGQALAAHAAVAMASAQNDAHLREAMNTRSQIGEATGILMERYKLTSRDAFALLVQASQNLNTRLRDLAEHLVETGSVPDGTKGQDKRT